MYKIIVAIFLHFVLTFHLYKGIKQRIKLLFVYGKVQKPLKLKFYKAYINNITTLPLPKIKHKSFININSPQLALGVYMASIFDQTLVEPLELQFVTNLVLSNNQHNCYYVYKIIVINKEFDIYLGLYHLNMFFSPIFTIKAVDKDTHRNLQLILA